MIENTAVSARYVAQQNDKQLAAIASRNCADLYGLTVLAEGIQDCAENFTRFVIVSRDGYSGTDWNKVSVRFSLPHKSGSLHEMLRIPAEEGVSLTSIVSRPYPGQSFQYYFYADIEADSTEQIEKALERMSDASRDWALLGRYASAERRTTWDASI
jgi:Prephenate dehydratase